MDVAFELVLRFFGYVILEVFFRIICYSIGYAFLKVVSFGKYPRQYSLSEGSQSDVGYCIGLGLLAVLLVVGLVVGRSW